MSSSLQGSGAAASLSSHPESAPVGTSFNLPQAAAADHKSGDDFVSSFDSSYKNSKSDGADADKYESSFTHDGFKADASFKQATDAYSAQPPIENYSEHARKQEVSSRHDNKLRSDPYKPPASNALPSVDSLKADASSKPRSIPETQGKLDVGNKHSVIDSSKTKPSKNDDTFKSAVSEGRKLDSSYKSGQSDNFSKNEASFKPSLPDNFGKASDSYGKAETNFKSGQPESFAKADTGYKSAGSESFSKQDSSYRAAPADSSFAKSEGSYKTNKSEALPKSDTFVKSDVKKSTASEGYSKPDSFKQTPTESYKPENVYKSGGMDNYSKSDGGYKSSANDSQSKQEVFKPSTDSGYKPNTTENFPKSESSYKQAPAKPDAYSKADGGDMRSSQSSYQPRHQPAAYQQSYQPKPPVTPLNREPSSDNFTPSRTNYTGSSPGSNSTSAGLQRQPAAAPAPPRPFQPAAPSTRPAAPPSAQRPPRPTTYAQPSSYQSVGRPPSQPTSAYSSQRTASSPTGAAANIFSRSPNAFNYPSSRPQDPQWQPYSGNYPMENDGYQDSQLLKDSSLDDKSALQAKFKALLRQKVQSPPPMPRAIHPPMDLPPSDPPARTLTRTNSEVKMMPNAVLQESGSIDDLLSLPDEEPALNGADESTAGDNEEDDSVVAKSIKFFEHNDSAKVPLIPLFPKADKKEPARKNGQANNQPLEPVPVPASIREGVDESPVKHPFLRSIENPPKKVARVALFHDQAFLTSSKRHANGSDKVTFNLAPKTPKKMAVKSKIVRENRVPNSSKTTNNCNKNSRSEKSGSLPATPKRTAAAPGRGEPCKQQKTTSLPATPKRTNSQVMKPLEADDDISQITDYNEIDSIVHKWPDEVKDSSPAQKENGVAANGHPGTPSKAPSRVPCRSPAPRKVPPSPGSRTSSAPPKTPDSPVTPTTPLNKKVSMNKVQVGAAPSPNLKNVRSKIGSLANTAHRPGGGHVRIESHKVDLSHAQPRIAAKNDSYMPGGGDKKIPQVRLDWKAKSKVGSLDNTAYRPSGGDKKIESVKLDFKERAKPRVGSKDNVHHVPGGGCVKIEHQKLEFKAESKIKSLDNVHHKPGGGDVRIFDDKQYIKNLSHSGSGTQIGCELSVVSEVQSAASHDLGTDIVIRKTTTLASTSPELSKSTKVTVVSRSPTKAKPTKQQVKLTYSTVTSPTKKPLEAAPVEVVRTAAVEHAPVLVPSGARPVEVAPPAPPSALSSAGDRAQMNSVDPSLSQFLQNEMLAHEKVGEIWKEVHNVSFPDPAEARQPAAPSKPTAPSQQPMAQQPAAPSKPTVPSEQPMAQQLAAPSDFKSPPQATPKPPHQPAVAAQPKPLQQMSMPVQPEPTAPVPSPPQPQAAPPPQQRPVQGLPSAYPQHGLPSTKPPMLAPGFPSQQQQLFLPPAEGARPGSSPSQNKPHPMAPSPQRTPPQMKPPSPKSKHHEPR